jgi:MarR family transcriptional regulator, negative regulator of the multidrug operon emrRAB
VSLTDETPTRAAAAAHGFDAADYEARSLAQAEELDPDADLTAMAVAFKVILASNHLLRDLESSVHRPAGISWGAFKLLWTIRAYGRLRPSLLSKLAAVSAPTVSSVLNTLERDGLIFRSRGGEADRRAVVVELTPAGEELLAQVWRAQHVREIAWAASLSEDEQHALADLLHKLFDGRSTS